MVNTATLPYSPVLKVDVDALRANYRTVQALANTAVACGAVLKADAYGTGLETAVRALSSEGCAVFFTAFTGEGARVRALAPDAEVFVLSPCLASDAPCLAEQALVPCLYDLESVESWNKAWSDLARGRAGLRPPAALHFETGINRLGWSLDQGVEMPDLMQLESLVEPRLIMSHLACADEPGHPMNQMQLDRFAAIAERFPGVRASLSNSGGAFLGADFHFNLLRPGVCLFGHDPHFSSGFERVRPVASLWACLAQVKRLHPGQTIGYGAGFTCAHPMRVGVVLAGYGDGVPRSLSVLGNEAGLALSVAGCPAPIVGRVSMDMVVVDLAEVPDKLAQPGAAVEIFGPNVTVESVAARAGTIPYELFTGVTARVRREYSG